jgi:hypothetical protein
MRLILPVLAAVSASTAAPARGAEEDVARLAEELNDPAAQAQISAMVETMSTVLLDMNVAPMLRAKAQIEGTDPEAVDPGLTVRDLAGPEAEEAPREIAHRVPQMMGAMATLAIALEQMLPQLRAIGDAVAVPPRRDTSE